MPARDIIIHIGLSKCASTYLQKSVFPVLGNYSNVAFAPRHEKYHVFRPDMRPEEYRDIVSRHMVNSDPNKQWLIISCEDYTRLLFRGFEKVFYAGAGLADDQYIFSNEIISANLARAYPGARIIIIIREQISWAVSRYKMNYRGGMTAATIDELLSEPLDGYDVLIKRYQDLFGKDQVLVLPYEMLHHNWHEFIRRIADFVCPGDAGIAVPDAPVNVAPDLQRTVEYERLKNSWRLRIRRAAWPGRPVQFMTGLLARILVACLKPTFLLRYGSRKYEVIPQAATLRRLKPILAATNRRTMELTGLNLRDYGYIVTAD